MLKFDHIALSVSSLASSIAFYQQLGFVPVQRWDNPDGTLAIALLKNENAILELFCYKNAHALPEYRQELSNDLQTIGTKHFALCTNNIQQSAKDLSAKGICKNPKILTGRLGRDYFFIKDPDGILIEIIQANN